MTDELPPPSVPKRLEDVAPAPKCVYLWLSYNEPGTQTQIQRDTQLPIRTVRAALQVLDDRGEVQELNGYADDGRRKWYERVRNS